MSKQIEKIEKELPTVSFTTNKDSKKYRDKKRKERQIKKEKGIKVNKIKKQVYNSDSEDEKDSDEDEIEDEFASLSEEEEEKEKEKVVENNKKQKTSSSSSSNEPVNRFELDKEALSNKLSSILAHGTSTKKQKQTTTTADGSTILSKSEQTLNETIKKEKEKNKQEKERQLEKELLQTKDYKPIEILLTPEERDLMRLAKKGVIKLFNAVTQHQQSGLTASVDQKSKNITKNQFLENLKNTKVKKANEDDDEDDYSDDDYSDDQKDGEQWDVLKDDYLVKNEYDIKEEQD
ncbi:hypothetical protein ACTFIR_012225 [Dictyostelium discoideum]